MERKSIMKPDEQEILSAYRPGTEDDKDPLMVEALDHAEGDPRMRKWFAEQMEMDDSIRDALAQEPAPDGLLDELLSIGETLKKPKSFSQKVVQYSSWFAIAACCVFGLGLYFKDSIINNQVLGYHPQLSKVDQIDGYREAMSTFVADTIINLDHYSENRYELNKWLGDEDGPKFIDLPSQLEALNTLGCKKFYWKNMPVSLVCFHSNEGKIVHLFILEGSQSPELTPEEMKELQYLKGLPSKGWEDREFGRSYMLIGSAPEVDLNGIMI